MKTIEWRCCDETKTVGWDECRLRLLDQNELPFRETYIETSNYLKVAEAIKDLSVRGIPAIGVAAAYGMVLAARRSRATDTQLLMRELEEAAAVLGDTRPTAISLPMVLGRMIAKARENAHLKAREIKYILKEEADRISQEELGVSRRIGVNGAELIQDRDTILTHCNAGALATVDYGTALAVIHGAHTQGKKIHVLVDETRPLLQGARLTTWELKRENIPASLICDNAAGYLMSTGRIQKVVVGAHRIAANGDVMNRIGTYTAAVLAKAHGIPFYVATPLSVIDTDCRSGREFPFEERSPEEILEFAGVRVAPEGMKAINPAFDVTPHSLVTAIITDRGVLYPPYDTAITKLLGTQVARGA